MKRDESPISAAGGLPLMMIDHRAEEPCGVMTALQFIGLLYEADHSCAADE
jgi:hypothetical protein